MHPHLTQAKHESGSLLLTKCERIHDCTGLESKRTSRFSPERRSTGQVEISFFIWNTIRSN